MDNHSYTRIVCTNCNAFFDVPVYCGNRFCPVCMVGRQSRVRRKLRGLVELVKPSPGYSIKHLTLTIRNMCDLKPMVEHLLKSFRRLRQRTFWKNYVEGGVFVVEVTGKPGDWHAHLHVVISARYLPYKKLLSQWIAVSGSRGVYIKRIPISAIVNYLTKYLTKTELAGVHQIEASAALKGKRMFQAFGCWHTLVGQVTCAVAVCSCCGARSLIPLDIVVAQLRNAGEEVKPRAHPPPKSTTPRFVETSYTLL